MENNILLVDDQREILRFLRAALETLTGVKMKIFESQSGEEALLESSRHKIDLLVTDYKLPGMTGLELMHKIRARHPDAKVILISGVSERKARQELANAGALAIFDKPISVADFLDAVERALGLVKTIFAAELKAEAAEQDDERPLKPSELLTNFRQDVNADAVLLINDSGFVQARAGEIRDKNEEERVLPFLNQIHKASLAVSSAERGSYHIFVGKDFDFLFAPINPAYSILIAGVGLASEERVTEMTANLLGLRSQVEKSLRSIGQTGALHEPKIPAPQVEPEPPFVIPEDVTPAADLEALFSSALQGKTSAPAALDTDDFWNQAAEAHGSKPANANVISLEEARKRGLISDDKK